MIRVALCLGGRMPEVTDGTAAPDQISYMDAAAGTAVGLDYKLRFVSVLGVRPGHAVLDIGCGPGTDLGRLADVVGIDGSVVGVDRDPSMLAEAARRLAHRPNVLLHDGDAHDLPLGSASVDRARTDRVLQHVQDPGRVLAEARRVLRPGGVLGMAEPDWDTLAVADEDVQTSRTFARSSRDGSKTRRSVANLFDCLRERACRSGRWMPSPWCSETSTRPIRSWACDVTPPGPCRRQS